MKVALLCNHPLAFPTIEFLLEKGALVGLGAPQIMHDTTYRLQVLAQEKKLPFVLVSDEPESMQADLRDWLNECKADVVLVLTFPFKLPESILRVPRFGFFNFHTGLLPHYRGPDPIFWQILNNEPFGGVTVHQMDKDFDKGPVFHCERVEILPEDTYGQHIQKLALASLKAAELFYNTASGDPRKVKLTRQEEGKSRYYGRPDLTSLLIDWEKMNSAQVKSLVRASNPVYGGAISFFRNVPLHVLQVAIGSAQAKAEIKAGTIVSASVKDGLVVMASDGKLVRLDVIYSEDGFFTGGKLAVTFNVQVGESFTLPA